jgi:hypothetical protein
LPGDAFFANALPDVRHESFCCARHAGLPFRLWSGVFLSFELKLSVDPDQRVFFDLQPAINRVDEKWELAPSVTVRLRRAPDLPVGEFDAHLRKHKPRLRKTNVTGQIHFNQQNI